MTNMKPFLKQGGRCRTQTAGFLRSFSVVLVLLPLLFTYTACGDINSKLRDAAEAGNTAKVEQLLKQGVDLNAKQEDGRTALMVAAFPGHTETAKALIDAGANANAKTNNGVNALQFAAALGHKKIVKILKRAGARR